MMAECQGTQPKLNPTVAQHAWDRDAQMTAPAQNQAQQLGQAPVQPGWFTMLAQMQLQQ